MKCKLSIAVLILLSFNACADDFYYQNGKRVDVYKLSSQRSLEKNQMIYYKNEAGQKLGIQDRVIAKCIESVDCKTHLSQFDHKAIKKLTDSIYLITVKEGTNVFAYSRLLHDDQKIEYAHPDFVKKYIKR